MKYRFISFMRIPEHLYCGVVFGHKAKGKPEWMVPADRSENVLLEVCVRCEAQRVIDRVATKDIVQIVG